MIDALEPSRNYPIPAAGNTVSEEFPRIGTAITLIGADVSDLFASLSLKAAGEHTHPISDVTGLQSALDGKSASSHTHALDDLSDVSVSGAANGQFLRRVAGQWSPATLVSADVGGLGTMAVEAAINYVSRAGGAAVLPVWSADANRPASPVNGWIGYNTTRKRFEGYIDGSWGGVGASEVFKVDQTFTLASVPQTLTISGGYDPLTVKVFRNGLLIRSGYTATNGTSITISTASIGDVIDVLGWNGFTVSGALSAAANFADVASVSAARTNLGLGTSATKDTGTSAGNVVELDGSAKLPAVDGSQLTGVIPVSTFGAVGTYIFGFVIGPGWVEGATLAGSAIYPAGLHYAAATVNADTDMTLNTSRGSTALSGTWRAMSRNKVSAASTHTRCGLFVRIA